MARPLPALAALLVAAAAPGCGGCSAPAPARGARPLTVDEVRARVAGPPGLRLLDVSCGARRLVFVGFPHSSDPANPDFARLEEHWRRFLAEVPAPARTVLVEGRLRRAAPDRTRAIAAEGGEGGLVTFLAREASVEDVRCPEPPPAETLGALGRTWAADEVCYAYWVRAVALWHRVSSRPAREAYVARLLADTAPGCDPARAGMERVHRRLHATPLDEEDRAFFERASDPGAPGRVAEILAAETRLRDAHLAARIARLWAEERGLFVVYGASHAVALDEVLRRSLCEACPAGACRVRRGRQRSRSRARLA